MEGRLVALLMDKTECETRSEREPASSGYNKAGLTKLAFNQSLHGTCFRVRSLEDIAAIINPYHRSLIKPSNGDPPGIVLTNRDVTRWKMASRAIQVCTQTERVDDMKTYVFETGASRPVATPRCKDHPGFDYNRRYQIYLGLSIAALIYGGLHALAWFAHFDSPTEQKFWRISACVVMGGVPISSLLWESMDEMMLETKSKVAGDLFLLGSLLLAGCAWLIVPVYVLARAYLVVECFINLSHLPAGVYDVPNWSAYFPHIS